jgi:hypothetical protein
MTFDQAHTQYVAALRKIIADDPTLGPVIAERNALRAEKVELHAAAMTSVNNRIRNTAGSDDALKAMKALRDLRLGA